MGNSIRYLLAVVLILLFAVFGTIFLVRQFTRSGTSSAPTSKVVHPADYVQSSDARAVWTQQGRVLGADRRRELRITVTPTERRAEIISGYQNKVEKELVLPNDSAAYETFMIALENAKFGQERSVKQVDERGVCPNGLTYIYEIHADNEQKSRLWSDNCLATDGTFAGKAQVVRLLFQNQITDFQKFKYNTNF